MHSQKKRIQSVRDEFWAWYPKTLSDKTALRISKVMEKADKEADEDIVKFHSGSYFYKVIVRWKVYEGKNLFERTIFALTNKIYHGQIVVFGKTIEF